MILSACKGRKQVQQTNLDQAFINTYWAQQVEYKDLSMKGKISIKGNGMDQTASLNVRMRKDSVIWMSFSMLGFEGLRVLITQDSFKMINRLEGTYLARSSEYVRALIGFDVELKEIQNLLVGNAPFDSTLYSVSKNDSTSWLTGTKQDIQNSLFMSKNFETMRSLLFSTTRIQEADIKYGSYRNFDNIEMVESLDVTVNTGMEQMHAALEYNSASTEDLTSFPFHISSGLKKI